MIQEWTKKMKTRIKLSTFTAILFSQEILINIKIKIQMKVIEKY